MKPEELMIGDIVLYENKPYFIRELGIFGENRDGDDYPAVCVGKPNGIGLILERNEIKPIPLTPEILEKNGFVENDGSTSWKFVTKRETLITIYGVSEYHLSINIKSTHGGGKGFRWLLYDYTIFYVHQLQQILRVFRVDKTIEL